MVTLWVAPERRGVTNELVSLLRPSTWHWHTLLTTPEEAIHNEDDDERDDEEEDGSRHRRVDKTIEDDRFGPLEHLGDRAAFAGERVSSRAGHKSHHDLI